MESRIETVISNDSCVIRLNADKGELLSYINNKTSFGINKLDEKQIKEAALNIFNEINI